MAGITSSRRRFSGLSATLLVALAATFILAPADSADAARGGAKASAGSRGYVLPFQGGVATTVTCGAGQDHHTTVYPSSNRWDWDFVVPEGTAVTAAASGVVTRAGKQPYDWGWGTAVEITHPNRKTTVYAHLASENVRVGQRVSRGQRIGVVGNTGRSDGTHLHFGVHDRRGLMGASLKSKLIGAGVPQTGQILVSTSRRTR